MATQITFQMISDAFQLGLVVGLSAIMFAFMGWEILKAIPDSFDRLDYWLQNRHRRMYQKNVRLKQIIYRRNRRIMVLCKRLKSLGGSLD